MSSIIKITYFFLNKGYKVTVIDNLLHKNNNIEQFNRFNNFYFINSDVRNEKTLTDLVKKNDIIFPLAAIVGAPLCDKFIKDAYEINELSIKKLIKIVNKDQIIIFPTTNSGYGITKKNILCTENMPLNPISHYGVTKKNAEKIIMEHKNAVSFRLATVFGTSFRNRIDLLVNFFVYKAVKFKKINLFQPECRRNYIHVDDVVNTFHHCIINFSNMRNNIYNVGLSEANLTKYELCKKIQNLIPELKIYISNDNNDPDKRDYFVSNKKLEATGWSAKVSLEDGIKELYSAYSNIKNQNEFDKNY